MVCGARLRRDVFNPVGEVSLPIVRIPRRMAFHRALLKQSAGA